MSVQKHRLYSGKIINLELEHVTLPNGVETELEIIHHPGGSAVVALDDRKQICLLRQYRHVNNGWIWELPAGKIDNMEEPILTAKRELEEEAGMQAKQWHSLGNMLSSPGIFTEVVYCYLASNLTPVSTRHEAEELIEIHWVPLQTAFNWAMDNTINDAKSVIAICRAYMLIENKLSD